MSENNQKTNRYAHLVQGKQQQQQQQQQPLNVKPYKSHTQDTEGSAIFSARDPSTNYQQQQLPGYRKAPPLGQPRQQAYYASFSASDWREQFCLLKERLLERAEEPQCQRRLILVIVCCALLLDNMLYMVIVPIIPDYLRSIGAWSTYTENAKWIRTTNGTQGLMAGTSGHRLESSGQLARLGSSRLGVSSTTAAPHWVRVGGQVVYEGEDSAVGFLFASKAIVQLVINPFSGAIIDRIGYEVPMMIGLTVMFFSTMVFACGQTYTILFLARSLQGVGSAFADTAGLAMIADRFTEEAERQRALGVALAFISFGCLVAPPFGSVLYQVAGKEVPFIILSLVCLLDGSLLLLVTPPGTFGQLLPSFGRVRASPQGVPATSMYASNSNDSSCSSAGGGGGAEGPRKVSGSGSCPRDEEGAVQTTREGVTKRRPAQSASPRVDKDEDDDDEEPAEKSQKLLKRQKSLSRRHSMTLAAAGEAPEGTPIYVLLQDPCIACCAGALVVANISLAFLEPTITIWVQNTMPDIEEWQMGMIWLPAFIPHVIGVYSTVKLADKYPRYQWLIAAIGIILEGASCLLVPFCSSFWSLIMPISVICFGIALIDTAILPTLGYLVDTRYVSVYGSIYAIADISYSLSYAVGPVIAGGIVEAIGFTALNILIAIVTLCYTPILMMLRNIHDYEPFEPTADAPAALPFSPDPSDSSGKPGSFASFVRNPIEELPEEEEGEEEWPAGPAATPACSPDQAGAGQLGAATSGQGRRPLKSSLRTHSKEPRSVTIDEESPPATRKTLSKNPFLPRENSE